MIAKNEIPILEFSDCRSAVINPAPLFKAPEKCLMTFFGEVLDEFTEKSGARMIGEYVSEMRNFPVYTVVIGGEKIALTQASVGGSSAATVREDSIRPNPHETELFVEWGWFWRFAPGKSHSTGAFLIRCASAIWKILRR